MLFYLISTVKDWEDYVNCYPLFHQVKPFLFEFEDQFPYNIYLNLIAILVYSNSNYFHS